MRQSRNRAHIRKSNELQRFLASAEILEVRQLLSGRSVISTPVVTGAASVAAQASVINWTTPENATHVELWVNRLDENGRTAVAKVVHDARLSAQQTSYEFGKEAASASTLADGRYRVWLRGINEDSGEKGEWSRPHTFTVSEVAPPVLSAMPDIVDDNEPTIRWTGGHAESTYDLYVQRASRSGAWVRERHLTGNSFTPSEPLPDGKYRAWIRSRRSGEVWGRWSAPISFRIDVQRPRLHDIASPSTDVTPTISWTTLEDFAKYDIWIGRMGQPGAAARLTATSKTATPSQALSDGEYRVWVRAQSADGKWTRWSSPKDFKIDSAPPSHASGVSRLAVVDGSTWHFDTNYDPAAEVSIQYGATTDQFVHAAWHGGRSVMLVVRPHATGLLAWYADMNLDGTADANALFGLPGDIAVTGDWNGDGRDGLGIVREESDGLLHWYLDADLDPEAEMHVAFGLPGDIPVVGDFDTSRPGDEIAVVRRNQHGFLSWYIDTDGNPGHELLYHYGLATDTPVVGDWDGDGQDNMGVVRNDGRPVLNWMLDTDWDPLQELEYRYGLPGHKPIPGDWRFPQLTASTMQNSTTVPIIHDPAARQPQVVWIGSTSSDNPVITHDVVVTNTGTRRLNLKGVEFTDSRFELLGEPTRLIAPGESATLRLQLDSSSDPQYRIGSHITIRTNDPDASEKEFRFFLLTTNPNRPRPEIDIHGVRDGGRVDLGQTINGTTDLTRTFTVENTGTGVLQLTRLTMSGPFQVSPLTVTELNPGQSTSIVVTLPSETRVGTHSGTLRLYNNDANESVYNFLVSGKTIAASPEIEIRGVPDNGFADLGSGERGTSDLTRTFVIESHGNIPVELNRLTVSGRDFTISPLQTSLLAPGQTTTFTVTLPTLRTGQFTATVNLQNSDEDESPYNFRVGGTITLPVPSLPDIELVGQPSGSSYSFGAVHQNAAARRSFTVKNTGTAGLRVSSIWTTNTTFRSEQRSLTIAPGQISTFTVAMTTSRTGVFSGDLLLRSNDPDENLYRIRLSGQVIPAPQYVTTHYVSMSTSGTVHDPATGQGVSFRPEDIIQIDERDNGGYSVSLFFDGSEHGLTTTTENIDALTIDGANLIISTQGGVQVPGVSHARGNDLLSFNTNTGRWSQVFDGHTNRLYDGSTGNIDAVISWAGGYAVSLTDNRYVGGVFAADEDLLLFKDGSWSKLFDGRDHHIFDGDVDAAATMGGNFTVSLDRGFSVPGDYAFPSDVIRFGGSPARGRSLQFNGEKFGLLAWNTNAYHVERRVLGTTAAARTAAVSASSRAAARSTSASLFEREVDSLFESIAETGVYVP